MTLLDHETIQQVTVLEVEKVSRWWPEDFARPPILLVPQVRA
jgi:hypothetical protein